MNKITFEWDASKASSNKNKHGISFDEDRFIMLGLSVVSRVLVVVHCYREQDKVIRIISARKATKKESTQYRGAL